MTATEAIECPKTTLFTFQSPLDLTDPKVSTSKSMRSNNEASIWNLIDFVTLKQRELRVTTGSNRGRLGVD